MKNKLKFLTAFALLSMGAVNAQTGIGNTDPKATLDVSGTPATATTADGIIAPRLTGDQLAAKTAYGAAQTATQVYVTAAATTPAGATVNVTAAGFYYFDGTAWQKVGGGSSKFDYNPTDTSIDVKFLSDGVTARPTNNKFVITDAGELRIGDPILNKEYAAVKSKGFSAQNETLNNNIVIDGANSASGVPYFNQTQFNGNKSRGTLAAPTSSLAGDFFATLSSGNYGVSGWHFNSTRISLLQEDTPTATSNPTQISFSTTSNNSLSPTQKMIIRADGNVGIGTTTPNASALLDVSTTTRGFLPPRMTSSEKNLISSPAEGLIVYCTNCLPSKGLKVFDGLKWVDMQGNPAPAAAFSFTGNYYHLPNFYPGKIMSTDNILFVEVNVTTVGELKFSSATVNGYAFNFTTDVVTTGIQYLQLPSVGTQVAFNAVGDAFTITGVGTTTQTQSVTITNSQLGSTLTTFSNGTENFSNNTTCQTKIVSTTSAGNCPATFTIGANTYNTVFINGQCWFKENLKELPTAPCSDAINTGCNTWLNTSVSDIGAWGYYNNTSTAGTAGWSTTAPAANEGLLYQWSAAMQGSIIERAKGVCPSGWHIPSECEWKYLEHGLGMTIADQNTNFVWRNSGNVGGKLSTVSRLTLASANGTGSNATGFTALLQGQRSANGSFANRTFRAILWSSSRFSTTNIVTRQVGADQSGTSSTGLATDVAAAVRCLKN